MDNSVYIALSKQLVQFRKMDVLAHNVANANTTSFKRNDMMLTNWTVDNGNRQKISFAQDLAMYRQAENGALMETGNSLDIALQGEGYFGVETTRGTRYTRDGSLQKDAQGLLMTSSGYPVLDNGGQRITIPEEARKIEIAEDGAIIINGEPFAEMDVTAFDNPQKLQREADTLYNVPAEVKKQAPQNLRIAQGFLEKSNVQSVVEISNMVSLSRSTGSTSQFIDTVYDLQRKAMSAWAKTGSQ